MEKQALEPIIKREGTTVPSISIHLHTSFWMLSVSWVLWEFVYFPNRSWNSSDAESKNEKMLLPDVLDKRIQELHKSVIFLLQGKEQTNKLFWQDVTKTKKTAEQHLNSRAAV